MAIQTNHPTRAMAVANWFLERCWNDKNPSICDQMKLYKLVFYTHGWYLGYCKTELFPEAVQAWPHGPVVPDLYNEFGHVRKKEIRRLGKRMEIIDDRVSMIEPKHEGHLDVFFESVWNIYGSYTGIQLSNMELKSFKDGFCP